MTSPLDGSVSPKVICISGLPGIGRRTLIREKVPSILNFKRCIEIKIEENDSIYDLCIKIADHAERYFGHDEFANVVSSIRGLAEEACYSRCIDNIVHLNSIGELPLLVDYGGLVDSDGNIKEVITNVLSMISDRDSIYIFLVSTRIAKSHLRVPNIKIYPLDKRESAILISRIAETHHVTIKQDDILSLAEYVGGYPLSAFFAIDQIKIYGSDLILKEKESLIRFRTSAFKKYVAGLDLSAVDIEVLQLLAYFSPLTLQSVCDTIDSDSNTVVGSLHKLIDLSLSCINESGFYMIAEPIVEHIKQLYGYPPDKSIYKIAKSLFAVVSEKDFDRPVLDISRSIFLAAKLSDQDDLAFSVTRLTDDLIKLATDLYHAREYDKSIEYLLLSLKENSKSITARSLLVKAYAQKERFVDAEKEIKIISSYAPERDIYFLKGFVSRKKGDYRQAIFNYLQAEKNGYHGVSIKRELAYCYFIDKKFDDADKYIKEALKLFPDNAYIVDLWIIISTQRRDEKAARVGLQRLELIEKPKRYLHRKSRVELAFGSAKEALNSAIQAVEDDRRPPFECLSHLAKCAILAEDFSTAQEALKKLGNIYPTLRQDIQNLLNCRLSIATSDTESAKVFCGKIEDKETSYYKVLRFELIKSIIESHRYHEEEYENLLDEFDKLKGELHMMSTSGALESDDYLYFSD